MSMEEALFLPIRQMNKPQYEITYRGKTYQSKRAFARENNIGIVCIREMMENHGVDFETAADILLHPAGDKGKGRHPGRADDNQIPDVHDPGKGIPHSGRTGGRA